MKEKKAWVVAVDMGYGHQRAAYPLKDIAYKRIITANSDKIISAKEKKMWGRTQNLYEKISRGSSSWFGKIFFNLFDRVQSISPYYPFRDLSKPSIIVNYIDSKIKKGLSKSAIDFAKTKDLPFIATFFIPAIAASYYKIKDIYCVVTDSDINRVWVAKEAKKSKINYLVPTQHTVRRLIEYGVPKDRIFLTGFPLPKENIGGTNLSILKKDMCARLPNLDPKKVFISRYKEVITKNIGHINPSKKNKRPLTITYVVGGAGAQKDIAIILLKSFKSKILKGDIVFNLVAGTRIEIKTYFEDEIKKIGLLKRIGKNINIIFEMDKKSYFSSFNLCLRTTDILWTKPSELSFYAGLGIPIILTPPIGSQEVYNRKWLHNIGAGHLQEDPRYANEWLFDWLFEGVLAEAAWKGFIEAPKLGVYNIEELVFSKKKKKNIYFDL